MKPLKLEVEGINSFTRSATIDFKRLSERGIFGIFGKTGSGKSTILDCIYLAFFGKIIRTKRTSEIINLQRKTAYVKLLFEAEDNGENKTFLISRNLEKLDDGKVNVLAEISLFNIETNEKNLIASGDDEVTKAVEDILGFGAEEFKKCIALPQGEYNRFLRESPQNKIATIAKIFDLDRFGIKLFEKSKNKLIESEKRLAYIDGVLSDFGGIEDTTIKSTKAEIKETNERLKKVTSEYEELKLTYFEKQKDDIVSAQKQDAKDKIEALEKELSQIENDRHNLQVLKFSHKISPTYAYLEAAKQDIETSEIKLKNIDTELTKATANLAKVESEVEEEKTRSLLSLTSLELNKKLLSEGINNRNKLKRAENRRKLLIEDLNTKKIVMLDREEENKKFTLEIEKLSADLADLNERAVDFEVPVGLIGDARNFEKYRSQIEIYETNQRMVSTKIAECRKKRTDAYSQLVNLDFELTEIKKSAREVEKSVEEFYGSDLAPELSLAKCAQNFERLEVSGKNLIGINKQIDKKKRDIGMFDGATLDAEREEAELKESLEQVVSEIRTYGEKSDKVLFEREKYFGQNLIGFMSNEVESGNICPICNSIVAARPEIIKEVSLTSYDFELQNIKHRTIEATEKKEDLIARLAQNKQNSMFMQSEKNKLKNEITALLKDKSDIEKYVPELKDKDEVQVNNTINLAKIAYTNLSELTKQLVEQNKLKLAKEKLCVKNSAFVEEIDKELEIYSDMQQTNAARLAELNISILRFEGEFKEDNIVNKIKEYEDKKSEGERLNLNRNKLASSILTKMQQKEAVSVNYVASVVEVKNFENLVGQIENEIADLTDKVNSVKVKLSFEQDLKDANSMSDEMKIRLEMLNQKESNAQKNESKLKLEKANTISAYSYKRGQLEQISEEFNSQLKIAGLSEEELLKNIDINDITKIENNINKFEEEYLKAEQTYRSLNKIIPRVLKSLDFVKQSLDTAESQYITLSKKMDYLTDRLKKEEENLVKAKYFLGEKQALLESIATLKELHQTIQGGKLVAFITEEYITRITVKANELLELLTSGRYQLVFDGDYVVCDNQNGGALRTISTLSGGETFIASLAVAIATTEILVKFKNKKLEFIFLDEGFGTLDNECIEMVMIALRKLKSEHFIIGLISHEETIKNKVVRKIEVEKVNAEIGSQIKLIL